jgi:DNA repair exonuclease SbcCD ATPase subunit
MKTTTKQEMVACPKCGAEFPLTDDRLKSILAEKDKELADCRKRIEELEAINESHRRLNEWSINQQLRKVKKRKADIEKGFG